MRIAKILDAIGMGGARGQEVSAEPVPDFEARAHDGAPRGLEHLLGHPTVLFFYPAAGTPG